MTLVPGQIASHQDGEINQTIGQTPKEAYQTAEKLAWQDAGNPDSPRSPTLSSQPAAQTSPSALQRMLQFFTNSGKKLSPADHRWLLMRIFMSIVDQLLDYSVVVTTILEQEYTLAAVQAALIVLAGWKTSFFIGSSFGNKKPVVVESEPEAELSERETELEGGQKQLTDSSDEDEEVIKPAPLKVVVLKADRHHDSKNQNDNQKDHGQNIDDLNTIEHCTSMPSGTPGLGAAGSCPPGRFASGSSAARPDDGGLETAGSRLAEKSASYRAPVMSASGWSHASVASKQQAEASYLHNAAIASAKPLSSLVSQNNASGVTLPKRYNVKTMKIPRHNPLNTVSLWGETSFISIVMSPRELFKGIFEIEKFKAVWIIVTGNDEEDLAAQKEVWGKFGSGELARGLFMTIPQIYVQMYVFMALWLGDGSTGRQARRIDEVQLYMTMASIISSVISATAACFNYERIMLLNSGLPAPGFCQNPEAYKQASFFWPIPLGMIMCLSRALEVSARTINVTFFLFFSSLSMHTKVIVVAGGEIVFLLGFAVRKVILTCAWRRAQRAQVAAAACEGEADEEEGEQARATPRPAPQSVNLPSLCETARLLLQSVSITLPMYTTVHSQRLFEAAFGPGIPYPLFYGYRIGVQSLGLHLALLLVFGVEASFPRFWSVLAPVMMVSLHVLWFPLWRAVVKEVQIFAREVHGVGKGFLA